MTVADDLRFNLTKGITRKEITITKGETSVIVRGLCAFHNLSFDPGTGLPVNDTNIRIIVSIEDLIGKFDIYKKDDSISIKGYEAKFKTIGEREITTRIKSTIPNYNKGTLSMICEFKRDE